MENVIGLTPSVEILPIKKGLYLFSVRSANPRRLGDGHEIVLPALKVGLGPGTPLQDVEIMSGPRTEGVWLCEQRDRVVVKVKARSTILLLTSLRGLDMPPLEIDVERLDAPLTTQLTAAQRELESSSKPAAEAPPTPAELPDRSSVTTGMLPAREASEDAESNDSMPAVIPWDSAADPPPEEKGAADDAANMIEAPIDVLPASQPRSRAVPFRYAAVVMFAFLVSIPLVVALSRTSEQRREIVASTDASSGREIQNGIQLPKALTPPPLPATPPAAMEPAGPGASAVAGQPAPTRSGGPGLLLVAQAGDTMQTLYSRVYRGLRPPPYSEVVAANPAPVQPGAVVVFPAPPDGWTKR